MEEKSFFPLFINIKNKKVLIIGAGKIAYRKAETLLKYGACVLVVTKEIKEEKFKSLKNIDIILGEFSENLLENTFMVICATDNKELNEKIYKICDERNILVNNITSKTEMNCRFGSIIDNEEYILGISAKGNPKRAKEMREKLETFFHER
ncbi:bifunctional precorrin-2 dehydrogenase/sirohydrochlorin ferrochelatase [Fusobacterium perfoetens]|uniref:precorrin-2 dehydrogenase/sirohydrochlorin ferrochelatase family protein n=1 Tax=Fusobacterium perfoetens TaxID=852 RepID=UPI0015A4CA42|nr:bifunctional precorrin-2 dehydrogenase/sirohydrochlorin ferrochelatase [Fusobacterium perfoetens]MCF2625211.1 bifunctional precorrin-2 dehydrogenase/sirohydrochlorin ferrochelatase [Fusobacterium perfoetens]